MQGIYRPFTKGLFDFSSRTITCLNENVDNVEEYCEGDNDYDINEDEDEDDDNMEVDDNDDDENIP